MKGGERVVQAGMSGDSRVRLWLGVKQNQNVREELPNSSPFL